MLMNCYQIFEAYTDHAIDMPLEKRLEDESDLENYIENVWPGQYVSKTTMKFLRVVLQDYLKHPPMDANDRYQRFEKVLTVMSLPWIEA